MFLNLSKGKEEVKALLTRGMVMGNPEGTKDDQFERLQTEMETMKVQMMGQLVGQMALIQNLAQGQEELKALVNRLHQDRCNQMGQTARIGDQVIDQPPVKSVPFQIASTSRAQQQSRQQQQGNRRRQNTSERRFTEVNMSLSQAL